MILLKNFWEQTMFELLLAVIDGVINSMAPNKNDFIRESLKCLTKQK